MEKNLNTPPTQLYNIHNDMKTLFDSLPYTKSFAKGEIIYHQGDIADSFYYIKKGKATVFKKILRLLLNCLKFSPQE